MMAIEEFNEFAISNPNINVGMQQIGWRFQVLQTISITSLGFLDIAAMLGQGVLQDTHRVAIYDHSGNTPTLHAEGIIDSTTPLDQTNWVRYTDLVFGTLVLTPGIYVLQGFIPSPRDRYFVSGYNLTTSAGINWTGRCQCVDSYGTDACNDCSTETVGRYGPDFTYQMGDAFSFECSCHAGYEGSQCETDTNEVCGEKTKQKEFILCLILFPLLFF